MLAAASARKLDKGGYSPKDTATRRDLKVSVEDRAGLGWSMLGVVAAELKRSSPLQWTLAEGRALDLWLEASPQGPVDFWGSLRTRRD